MLIQKQYQCHSLVISDVTSKENSTFALFYYEYENGLNGRTFKEIREKKGLTYGISNILYGSRKVFLYSCK